MQSHGIHQSQPASFQNFLFLLKFRIPNRKFKDEPIKLSLGQGKGAFILDRVLGSHDNERIRQPKALPIQRHLVFLHGFQQCRLGFGRSPVDLIGEQDMGKDGTLAQLEFVRAAIIDVPASDIAGEEVRGELNTLELQSPAQSQRSLQ